MAGAELVENQEQAEQFVGIIASSVMLSCKMVSAVAQGRPILTPEYAKACADAKRLLPFDDYVWTNKLSAERGDVVKQDMAWLLPQGDAWRRYFADKPEAERGVMRRWNVVFLDQNGSNAHIPVIIRAGGGAIQAVAEDAGIDAIVDAVRLLGCELICVAPSYTCREYIRC